MSDNSPPDAHAASRELFDRAREAMLGLFQVTPSADPSKTVQEVTAKVVESQRRAFEMMNGMADVWSDLARRGSDGPEAWKRVLDDTVRMMTAVPGSDDPRRAFEAWRQQGEQMFAGLGPVASAMGAFFLPPGGAAASPSQMTEFLSSPGFGMNREYQAKVGQLFERWLDLQQRELEYRQTLNEAWTEAFRRMAEQMGDMAKEGRRFEHPRELMDAWVKVADEVFTHHFHTESFAKIQGEMLNTAHRVRRSRRELTEDLLRAQDLPTRTDLEEAHKMIYQLRRELRGLKRDLSALQGDPGNQS